MTLYTHAEPEPAADVGVSHALLERAAARGETAFRIWRPARAALSLGRLDARDQRVAQVAQAARQAGATPVRRLAGGRAVTLGAGCVCLGWAQPQARMGGSHARYELIASVIGDALGDLGVETTRGEAPGEWCPGPWSVHGPHGKLAGVAQRLVAGGAWAEALIVIERDPVLDALARRAYELLGLPWREDAQGEVATLLAERENAHERLADALMRALRERSPGVRARPLPKAARERALELAESHRWP